MSGAQRINEARAVAEFYAGKGWDAQHVCAFILNRPEPTAEMGTGAEAIAVERAAQLLREGFTPKHDAEHVQGELADAAACYALIASYQARTGMKDVSGHVPPLGWPWEAAWWKPSAEPMKNLVRAGALLAAEIDRRVLAEREAQLELPAPEKAEPRQVRMSCQWSVRVKVSPDYFAVSDFSFVHSMTAREALASHVVQEWIKWVGGIEVDEVYTAVREAAEVTP
jgi:hypothetical protein